MPHIHEKTTFEMYDTILKLYQSIGDTRKLAPKEKLRSIQMSKDKGSRTLLVRERTFQIGKGFGLTAYRKRSEEEPVNHH